MLTNDLRGRREPALTGATLREVDYVVRNPGPIPYEALDVAGDGDLEQTLRDDGLVPSETTYRLVEIPVKSLDIFPWLGRWSNEAFAQETTAALAAGQEMPPIVVRRVGEGFVLIDGVHRGVAHAALGRPTILAYEVLA